MRKIRLFLGGAEKVAFNSCNGSYLATQDCYDRLYDMRKLVLVCCFLFTISLSAQERNSEMALDLGIGQTILMDKAEIKFLKVTSDSRCPTQVTCIWPGEAKVLLGITVGEKYFEKELVVSGTGAEFSIAEDLQLLVSQLRPYPKTAIPIAPQEYCLKIGAVEIN